MPLSNDEARRLNAKEKEALRLLADGHTTKTAAAEIGVSENAVAERLRSARRKTGAGSSRELGRQLRAQESCDDFSGLRDRGDAAEKGAQGAPSGPRRWTSRRIVLMSSIAISLAAIAAAIHLAGPGPDAPDDALPQLAPAGAELRERLEAERADPSWARQTQLELSRRFAGREGAEMVAVRCRRTLCEVNVRVEEGERTRAIRAIGEDGFIAQLAEDGLGRATVFDMRFVEGEEGPGTVTVFLERGSP